MKRLSYSFVKETFEKEGYTLLSKDYINNYTKLRYICPNGHRHSVTWRDWYSVGNNKDGKGSRCPYCSNKIKLTYEFVKSEFEEEGYELLSTEYVNNHTKLDYLCPDGHEHSITWNDWQQGYRCPYCYGNVQYGFEEIKSSFEKEGYILLSEVYVNNKTKLSYICPNGHVGTTIWSNWLRGHRCQICWSIGNFGEGNPNWQGGKSFEGYCSVWQDQEYKQDIRERDGNKCLNPYCNSKDPNDLTIHHIDYNKQNCHPSNLITVCRSCNAMANKDRKWHKAWYRAIMYIRYNYIY